MDINLTSLKIHAEQHGAAVGEKAEFFQQLHTEIAKVGQSMELISLGDINNEVGS